MITKKHTDALAAFKFDLLKSKDILKDNLEALRNTIQDELDSLIELASAEVCASRFEHFQIEGSSPIDFAERIIELDEDRFILAGIRFRGLNINKPFILIQSNFNISSVASLEELRKVIRKEFAIFNPKSFQFTLPAEMNLKLPHDSIDCYTIAGSIVSLLQKELPTREEKIELLNLTDVDFYPIYRNEYKIFHTKSPDLIDEVKLESLEDLQEAMENKLLYKILINGKDAGIVAGLVYDYYGQKGVCILEEILYDSYKGKGLGVYVQKAFTKELSERFDVLWGTISHLNQPSLKTALRNGRTVEEIEYSFNL